MPWPSERKQQTRNQILNSAVALFSGRGFDNVSIGDVMKHAGLTHGAFYAHFDSKQALYAEAISVAAKESALAKFPAEDLPETVLLSHLLSGYLDIAHIRQEHAPCPLAFLATDVANREPEVRQAYTKVYKRLVALINKQMPETATPRRSRALALSALMIGGVALSRAPNDERIVRALLEACKGLGEKIIAEDSE